ncbi:AfsR/SARP family transcriptional regulator [Amycolatopsis australiensis]|uniref:DNA-binding transcriptional activator of the SARP family n=1 Tax=Amycolatopsis australiensis TaxID=546364 RepID=A0A1K1SR22_9PSEU|nr:BTAD domain-containing putative transcriptional regulator [Amycolatopsis australiensis]SFW86761.1 DNA-binding transcriptional activator of the SARP family [Amycolatopsis australiensis]
MAAATDSTSSPPRPAKLVNGPPLRHLADRVRFHLLGPVEVVAGGRPVRIGGPKPQALLAALLTTPGRSVEMDHLVDAVWGDHPAGSARAMVQTYVSAIRVALAAAGAGDVLTRQGSGYRISVDDVEIDQHEFADTVVAARAALDAGEHRRAAAGLRGGLSLWRGAAFGGLGAGRLLAEAHRLDELRLTAIELRVTADLAGGEHEALIPELQHLVADHPFRERFWRSLMVALHRANRRADAMAAFSRVRDLLANELGVGPGAELRQTYQEILEDDVRLLAETRSAANVAVLPRQLPADAPAFTGRASEIARTIRRLHADGLAPVVIAGPPGIGKTALAVRVAHLIRQQFPDGQLFVDLRGYGPGQPLDTAEALSWLLGSLGVAPSRIPGSADERALLYRSLVADRRILVVVDDAAHADQVRPLLPGSASCAIIVTSRHSLRGLAAREEATVLTLEPLPAAESLQLLRGVVGTRAVNADPAAAARLADRCGHWPLALRIAAAQVCARPNPDIAAYLAELTGSSRLDTLAVADDDRAAMRAAFDSSYAALRPEDQELFRRLGQLPSPDVGGPQVAALTDGAAADVRSGLERLAAASLLKHAGAGCYRLHELLRAYAADLAERNTATADGSRSECAVLRFPGTALAAVATPQPCTR